MTTIACRGGVMAADSQCSTGDLRDTYRKIIRTENAIVGLAGSLGDSQRLASWFLAGADVLTPPRFTIYGDEKPNAHCLILKPDGSMWTLDRWLSVDPVHGEFWAIGSGAAAALGAMHMGADAHRAVEIAALVDVNTGGAIETAGFENARAYEPGEFVEVPDDDAQRLIRTMVHRGPFFGSFNGA